MRTSVCCSSRDDRLALLSLVFLIYQTPAMARTEVRPYPDPGHRWHGLRRTGKSVAPEK